VAPAGETLAQTADLSGVPGVVLNYQLNATRRYFFSDPEIVVLPNGDYVASHALAGSTWTTPTGTTTGLLTGSDAPPWNSCFGGSGPLWFEGQVMASSATGVVIMPKVRPESPPVNFTAKPPYAAVINVTSQTTTTFDPATGFVPLPGGAQ